MAGPECEEKESLEVDVRQAVAHEKELETTLPEPEERKAALEAVELASLNLKNHLADCEICQRIS